MLNFEVVVTIPRLSLSMPDLDATDTAFNEPPRNQYLTGLGAGAVGVEHPLWLTRHVKSLGCLALHPVGEFERLNASFQLLVVRAHSMHGVD